MKRDRDKRITVRFRSDDPAIAELYTTLQQRRRTTRKTMNTLVLNALQVAFGWEDHSEQRLRAIVREEVRAAFPGYPVWMSELPLSIAVHIGPGSLAVTWTKVLPEGMKIGEEQK